MNKLKETMQKRSYGSKAKSILSSKSATTGIPLHSLELRYWRPIHGELLTHRKLSRSCASSRAIPTRKILRQVVFDTAGPVHWGKNQPGMQAKEELGFIRKVLAKAVWKSAALAAAWHSWLLHLIGVHKQIANRPLEPYQWMVAIFSGTDWANFLALRNHPDAQPEIAELARKIEEIFRTTVPQQLKPGEWHLPYVSWARDFAAVARHLGPSATKDQIIEGLRKVSAARCARVSYNMHDGSVPSVLKDLVLFARLAYVQPMHASPMEHQGTPDRKNHRNEWVREDLHGNFSGWEQSRQKFKGNYVKEKWN